jgi:hypothetical protein
MSEFKFITRRSVAATGLFLGIAATFGGVEATDDLTVAKSDLSYSEGLETGYMHGRDLNPVNYIDESVPEDREYISSERDQQVMAQEVIDENLPPAVVITFGGLALTAVSGIYLVRAKQ